MRGSRKATPWEWPISAAKWTSCSPSRLYTNFPTQAAFFAEVAQAMKAGATLLLSEPGGHVDAAKFSSELETAFHLGLKQVETPVISRSHAPYSKSSKQNADTSRLTS